MTMYNKILGKKIYSIQYGVGTIINEDDGLIWIDFDGKNKKSVCFQATAAFSKEQAFLTSTDSDIIEYLNYRKDFEATQKAKVLAIEALRYLKIDDKVVDDFMENDTIYLINGNSFTKVQDMTDKKLIKGIEWYAKETGDLVYAAFPVPDEFGNGLFTYALLYIRRGWQKNDERFLKVKGNLGFAYAFYQHITFEEGGEDRPLGLHLSNGGAYAMPEMFLSPVFRLLEKD